MKIDLEKILNSKVDLVSSNGMSKLNTALLHFDLQQNYPNPFSSSTRIGFALPRPEDVTIEIFNALGRRIETILNMPMTVGQHHIEFNGSHLSGGIYFYRIEAGKYRDYKKMMLVK